MDKFIVVIIVLVVVFFINQPDKLFNLINQPKVEIHLDDFNVRGSINSKGDFCYDVNLTNTNKDPVVISVLKTEGSLDKLSDTVEVNKTIAPNESITVPVCHYSAVFTGIISGKQELEIKVFVKDSENKSITWVKRKVRY